MTTGQRQTLVIRGHHALPLAGWDRRSVWGMDPMEATYGLYAQLWHNADAGRDNPRHWIMEVPDLLTLCRQIAAATGCTEDEAADAVMAGVRNLEAEQGVRPPVHPDVARLSGGPGNVTPVPVGELMARVAAEPAALPDGRLRILCLGPADGRADNWPTGGFLADYDPEAADGHGSASWTPDPAKAMSFDSGVAAMLCYRAQPEARPLRADGKPNRPLTIFRVAFW